jgi:hypothetical protein
LCDAAEKVGLTESLFLPPFTGGDQKACGGSETLSSPKTDEHKYSVNDKTGNGRKYRCQANMCNGEERKKQFKVGNIVGGQVFFPGFVPGLPESRIERDAVLITDTNTTDISGSLAMINEMMARERLAKPPSPTT